MAVQVIYQGLLLSQDARMRAAENALFVELELPMPVGSNLELVGATARTSARVTRVHEGLGAGMIVVPADNAVVKALLADASVAAPAPVESQVPPNVVPAAAAPVQIVEDTGTRMEIEPPAPAAAEAAAPDGDTDSPDDTATGRKRRQRTKTRKTVIGH